MDSVAGSGVNVVQNMEETPWPFPDGYFREVLADKSLEHVIRLDRVVFEIARVLGRGGQFTAIVPYGLESLYDPFHHRAFNEISFARFTTHDSDLHSAPLFRMKGISYEHNYPGKRILARHFGFTRDLPIGRPRHITFELVRL